MIIKGPTYIDGEIVMRYIGIDDGKISFVKRALKTTEEVFDWDGVILPAGTDMHVHFRDPGHTKKEDFFTGTLSAAHGGITTIADMPNNDPPTNSLSRLKNKISMCSKKACVDFFLYGMLSEEAEDMLTETRLFKVFLSDTTGVEKNRDLKIASKVVFDSGGLVAFHCESNELFGEPGEDLAGYNKERPKESEVRAIESLREWPKGRKHVCHITSEEGLKAAREVGAHTEVTPHHLFFTDEVILDSFGKVNPPLRGDSNHFSMWENFERGNFDVMASDHAPHLEAEKAVEFPQAPAGLPGVETTFPLMMSAVAMGRIDLTTVVDMISYRPARLLGIQKGKIEEGYDADLALFDFREIEPISSDRLHSKCGWSPYEGSPGIFPRHVICRGEFVVKNRRSTTSGGRGRYLFTP